MALTGTAESAHAERVRMFTIHPAWLAQIELIHYDSGSAGIPEESLVGFHIRHIGYQHPVSYCIFATLHGIPALLK